MPSICYGACMQAMKANDRQLNLDESVIRRSRGEQCNATILAFTLSINHRFARVLRCLCTSLLVPRGHRALPSFWLVLLLC